MLRRACILFIVRVLESSGGRYHEAKAEEAMNSKKRPK